MRAVALVAVFVLTACSNRLPEAPIPEAMSPATGPEGFSVAVTITGSFFVDVQANHRGGDHTLAAAFTARLGQTSLDDVAYVDQNSIRVTVPNTIDIGQYDLILTDAAGRTGTLEDAFVVTNPICDASDPTLTACFRFEGDVVDESGFAHAVTSAGLGFAPGVLRQALDATSTTSVAVADSDVFDGPGLTIELSLNPSVIPGAGRAGLLDKDQTFGMFLQPSGALRCSAGSGVAITPPSAVTLGNWTRVACRYDDQGQTLEVFIDGVLSVTVPANNGLTPSAEALHIGENSPDGLDQFIGLIDNLRIWNVPLPDGQL